MPSGPGAEEGEQLLRACCISSGEREVMLGCRVSLPLAGGGGFGTEEVFKEHVVYEGRGVSSGE